MIVQGDCLEVIRDLPDSTARCCITSPPYWGLRDYGVDGQLGLEKTPDEYVAKMIAVFREVRRVLADDGTLWLNLGDSYAQSGCGGATGTSSTLNGGIESQNASKHVRANRLVVGLKPKDLVGIPWMVAFALRADGWYLRQEIIWAKPNPMPESVTDRCTKSHEHIFLLSKSPRYYWDVAAALEPFADARRGNSGAKSLPYSIGAKRHDTLSDGVKKGLGKSPDRNGRNRRDVWTISIKPFKGAHFATFPPDLVEPCLLIGSAPGDVVIDPFAGSGTVGMVAKRHGREFLGIELNPEYVAMAEERCK